MGRDVAVNGAARGLRELREHALEERQSAERGRVLAHRITTLLLALAVARLLAAGAADGDALGACTGPVLIAVVVVHGLMPL